MNDSHERAQSDLLNPDPTVRAGGIETCIRHGYFDLLLRYRVGEHPDTRAAARTAVLAALEGPITFPPTPTGDAELPVYLGEAEREALRAHTSRLNDNVAGLVSRLCPLVLTELAACDEERMEAWRHTSSPMKMTLKVPHAVQLVVQGHAWRLDVSPSNVVHAILALGQAHLETLPVRTD